MGTIFHQLMGHILGAVEYSTDTLWKFVVLGATKYKDELAAIGSVGAFLAALAALISARATQKTVREMKAARLQSLQPVLNVSPLSREFCFVLSKQGAELRLPEATEDVAPHVLIRNDGVGVALSVKVSITLQNWVWRVKAAPQVGTYRILEDYRRDRGEIDLSECIGIPILLKFTAAFVAIYTAAADRPSQILPLRKTLRASLPNIRVGTESELIVPIELLHEALLAHLLYRVRDPKETISIALQFDCRSVAKERVTQFRKFDVAVKEMREADGKVMMIFNLDDHSEDVRWEVVPLDIERWIDDQVKQLWNGATDNIRKWLLAGRRKHIP